MKVIFIKDLKGQGKNSDGYALKNLYENNIPIDMTTLENEHRNKNFLEE